VKFVQDNNITFEKNLQAIMKKSIQSSLAPAAIGPYSQAIEINGYVYLSGQLGIDASTGLLVEESKEAQLEQVFKNIGYVLNEAGCTFDHVVKCTAFLTDMNDFALFNGIYARYFMAPYPARSAFQVAALPKKGAIAEMEVIAKLPAK